MKSPMKSKKHILIISCVFAIIASVGFSSIFYFDFKINKINEDIDSLEKKREIMLFNIEQSLRQHNLALNMNAQIHILSVLNADISLRNEEHLDLLASSAAIMTTLVRGYKEGRINPEDVYEELRKKITSYEDFKKIHDPHVKLANKYSKDENKKIKTKKKEIENIMRSRSRVLIIAIIFNIITLILSGIATCFEPKGFEKELAKEVRGLIPRVNTLIKKLNKKA